jgi:hypothetical protein
MVTVAVVVGGLAVAAALVARGEDPQPDQEVFCQRLDRLSSNDPFLAFGDRASPEEIQAGFAALRERAGELVEVAPDDVRNAARDYRQAVVALDDLLAAADYRSDVDPNEYRKQQLLYVEASQRLERYLTGVC